MNYCEASYGQDKKHEVGVEGKAREPAPAEQ